MALTTDAFAFLNVNDPVCAWATYRGELVCAPTEPGFFSVWSAATMRSNDAARISRELLLEASRRKHSPERISRLRGMFCFLDIKSAESACSWAGGPWSHFRPEYLAELSLEGNCRRDRLDSNWITYAPRNGSGNFQSIDWMPEYWAARAYSGTEPIWETLVDGRMIVLGTDLRERAYDVIKRHFPETLTFLEIARIAALVGSDLGSVCAYLKEDENDLILTYIMDMRDANDASFISKLQLFKEEGHPINWPDISLNLSKGTFGRTMDLRPLGFRRPKIDMPYVGASNDFLDSGG